MSLPSKITAFFPLRRCIARFFKWTLDSDFWDIHGW